VGRLGGTDRRCAGGCSSWGFGMGSLALALAGGMPAQVPSLGAGVFLFVAVMLTMWLAGRHGGEA